jgi:chemotaxis protein methyltransferase CheR
MRLEPVKTRVARELGLEVADDEVLEAAVRQRASERKLSPAQYIDLLDDHRELDALGQLLTVGETYFFRMRGHFEALRALATQIGDRPPIVLSAGCSTGEEAYSIAIALRTAGHPEALVMGTDLNQRALETARAATYSEWALRGVLPDDRERWFLRAGARWEVRPEIREMVQLRRGNLFDEGAIPLGPFDAIFCRNVIMYFTRDAARTAVARLTAALRPGGLLFLGYAETLRGLSDEYVVEQCADVFHYRHRRPSAPPLPPPPVAAPPPPPPPVQPVVEATVRELEPTVPRAMALLDSGRLDEAEAMCTQLIARDETAAEPHYMLGLAAEARGERAIAIDRHRAALYLEPDFALAHLQLGRLERREGEVDRARRDLRHAVELLTHETAARLALFGGGFDREGLIALGRAELAAL